MQKMISSPGPRAVSFGCYMRLNEMLVNSFDCITRKLFQNASQGIHENQKIFLNNLSLPTANCL